MKIAWVVDAWPSGTSSDAAARELAELGARIVVFAGAVEHPSAGLPVHVLSRASGQRDHWQRSASASVRATFRALLRSEAPDVVHVHHWRSLSRDLVFTAGLERRPAVVSLHDLWTTCLIGTRRLPRTGAACEAPLAAHPCIACAPRTPWVPIEAQYLAFAEHKSQIVRELELARAVLVRDRAHADAIRRFLGDDAAKIARLVEADSNVRDARALLEIHASAVAAGAPVVSGARADDWYTQRMEAFAEAEWERGAQAHGFR